MHCENRLVSKKSVSASFTRRNNFHRAGATIIDVAMIEQLLALRLPLGNQLALAPFSIASLHLEFSEILR